MGGLGEDVLYGGPRDDVLAIGDATFRVLDRGTGADVLRLDGPGFTLDVTAIPELRLRSLETIDLSGAGNHTLVLAVRDFRGLSEGYTIAIEGDAGDTVTVDLTDAFTASTEGGYRVFTDGITTLRVSEAIVAFTAT